ncbi:hypothetical protein Q7P37_003851 [Cladosporium fusiforme]
MGYGTIIVRRPPPPAYFQQFTSFTSRISPDYVNHGTTFLRRYGHSFSTKESQMRASEFQMIERRDRSSTEGLGFCGEGLNTATAVDASTRPYFVTTAGAGYAGHPLVTGDDGVCQAPAGVRYAVWWLHQEGLSRRAEGWFGQPGSGRDPSEACACVMWCLGMEGMSASVLPLPADEAREGRR